VLQSHNKIKGDLKMIKTISKIAIVALLAVSFTACNKEANPSDELDERCFKQNEVVPEWVCDSSIEGADYAAVGIGTSKNESMKVQQAITRARAKLAAQVKVKVKAKMEDFMRATGNGDAETIDAVTTSVTKQTTMLDLSGSRKVKEYTSRKTGTLFVLVAVDDTLVNKAVKKTITQASSHKNEDALWQQFQSKQALDSLDKEFPTD
jgi:hypothetical protein